MYSNEITSRPPLLVGVELKMPEQPVDMDSVLDMDPNQSMQGVKKIHFKSESDYAPNRSQFMSPDFKRRSNFYRIFKVQQTVNKFIKMLRIQSYMLNKIAFPFINRHLSITAHGKPTYHGQTHIYCTESIQAHIKRTWFFIEPIIMILIAIACPLLLIINFDAMLMMIFILAYLTIRILVQINTYIIEKGEVIKDRNMILKGYINNYFTLDLSQLSLALFLSIKWNEPVCLVLMFINHLQLLLIKVQLSNLLYTQISRISILWLISIHNITCIWMSISDQDQYLTSVQIMIQILLSGGSFITQDQNQALFSVLVTIFGYALQVAALIYLLSLYQIELGQQLRYESRLFQISSQLSSEGFSRAIRQRVGSYLDFLFTEELNISQTEFFNKYRPKLPELLGEELRLQTQGNILEKCHLFNLLPHSLRQLTSFLIEQDYKPDDFIISENIPDDASLYVIKQGEVRIIYADAQRHDQHLAILKSGSSFGEYSFFTGLERTASVQSHGFSKIYKLRREDYIKVISQTKDFERYHMIKDSIIWARTLDLIKLQCFCCKAKDHLVKFCPKLHYLPDSERVIKQLLMWYKQPRQKEYIRGSLGKHLNSRHLFHLNHKIALEFQNANELDDGEQSSSDMTLPYSENNLGNQSYRTVSAVSKQNTLSQIRQQDVKVDIVHRAVDRDSNNQVESDFNDIRKDESFLQMDNMFTRKQDHKETHVTAGFGLSNSMKNSIQVSKASQKMDQIEELLSESGKEDSAPRKSKSPKYTFMKMSQSIKDQNVSNRPSNRSLTYSQPQDSQQPSAKSILLQVRSSNSNSPNISKNKPSGSLNSMNNAMLPQQQIILPSAIDPLNDDMNNSVRSKSISRYFSRSQSKKKSNATRNIMQFQSQQHILSEFKAFSSNDNPVLQQWSIKDFEIACEYKVYFPNSNVSKIASYLNLITLKQKNKIKSALSFSHQTALLIRKHTARYFKQQTSF